MKALLDTHAILWFLSGDPKLAAGTRTIIADRRNTILASVGSLWEMVIKLRIGKLDLEGPFQSVVLDRMARNDILAAPIENRHLLELIELPLHHRDPFDRLLAAHCRADGLPIVSADSMFDAYGVSRIW